MNLAKVIRPLWASKKDIKLNGIRLLEVEILDSNLESTGTLMVVADALGANKDEIVLTCTGSKVRNVTFGEDKPIKQLVIAIIDDLCV